MTPEQFRRIALHLPEAVEASHHGHPDFRVGGKIFATLGYPDESQAAILLIENTTTHRVSVYLVDRAEHVRLGWAEPQTEARVPVRKSLLQNRTVFRIYAFRGLDACPVARVVNISTSRTPRITVAATDTAMSAYLAGDGCRKPPKAQ